MFEFILDNWKVLLPTATAVIGWVCSVVQKIKKIVKDKKEKNTLELKELLKETIIPLMEEAEKMLKDGTEREDWVIKKLSLKTHIDFYKYQNILSMAKEIISNICETTRIDINKTIVIEEKEPKKEVIQSEVGTNGVF